jgi:addiction module RelE/StbE family toxin
MQIVFDDRAIADLESIYHWIAKDSPTTAKNVVDRLFSSIELLTSFPRIGRTGHVSGTLEWVVPRLPYIVVYEVDQSRERVVVVAVFHGARDREG